MADVMRSIAVPIACENSLLFVGKGAAATTIIATLSKIVVRFTWFLASKPDDFWMSRLTDGQMSCANYRRPDRHMSNP
jgi:hypothetical protein